MADQSKIEWTDATWNPVTGCTEVSPGCDHCYAKTFAERWRGTPGHHFENGFDLTLRPERLDQPRRWTKPRRVFVNSMSDLFHDGVPDLFIARVFAVMAVAEQHTFQVLTKRHARMRSLLSSPSFWHHVAEQGREYHIGCQQDWMRAGAMLGGKPLPNVWLGVSVEDQKWADIRIPALLDTPAAVRFLSCEPLLGPVHITKWLHDSTCVLESEFVCTCYEPREIGIDWVIVGGESGPGAREMYATWARTLRNECVAASVPFLFKQWGGIRPKAGGRELDGRTWDEFPEVSP